MIGVVVDTNVFLSGIFWKGNFSSQIIDLWRNRKINLISSIPIIDELTKNLKFFKIKMDEDLELVSKTKVGKEVKVRSRVINTFR